MKKIVLFLVVLISLCSLVNATTLFSDDFSDNNLFGWTNAVNHSTVPTPKDYGALISTSPALLTSPSWNKQSQNFSCDFNISIDSHMQRGRYIFWMITNNSNYDYEGTTFVGVKPEDCGEENLTYYNGSKYNCIGNFTYGKYHLVHITVYNESETDAKMDIYLDGELRVQNAGLRGIVALNQLDRVKFVASINTPSHLIVEDINCYTPNKDEDSDGYSIEDGDCNDNNSSINPNATEVFDGLDNDCDGLIDEGFVDTDNDGVPDMLDICPNTPIGEDIDNNGCSNPQFCEKQSRCGLGCDGADWKHNEPLLTNPHDCMTVIIHKGGIPEPICAGSSCAD